MRTGDSIGTRWHVVRTKPKQEARADANLRAWGLETFAPRLWQAPGRGWQGPETAPLFPGYLFARFEAGLLLAKVRLTRGVHSIVGLGEAATPVDDAAVALIRGRLREDGLVHLDEPALGDAITIVSGPLRSLSGVFERNLKGRDRVLILLTSLNAPVHVQLPMTHIRKARQEAPVATTGSFGRSNGRQSSAGGNVRGR